MWPVLDRQRPKEAIIGGLAVTLLVAAVFGPLHDDVTRAVPALVLVVPVVGAAVIGGRRAGFVVAAGATLAFSLAVPPIGSLRVYVSEDVLALAVFFAVAFVVSALVTTKVATLENIDAQRRALLRSVSHDLRTPLAAIHGVATDLRAGADYDDVTRAELLDLMVAESERLDRLVANLLSMSRIEAGTLHPDLQAVDVGELVAVCTKRFENAPVKVVVDVPAELPYAQADHTLLEQVVNNLLDNTVKHTPPGTTVHVDALADADTVSLRVGDDGPGLPVPRRAGLGLTICDAIVKLHNGTFDLGPPGPGTTITATLPRAN